MLHSLRNLLGYSWEKLVTALGTTTLSIVLFSFAIPMLIFVVVMLFNWKRERMAGATVKQITKKAFLGLPTLVPSLIYLVVWICLLIWAISTTAYRDHEALLGRIRQLNADNKVLSDKNRDLESITPQVVTRTLPAPEQEKKCWVSNHFGMPNSTIKGAMTATAAIVRCNYKIDAPFLVQVEFDRDFIPGALVLTDTGIVMMGGENQRGRIIEFQVNSPALLSNQLAVVTVYGATDQYPRALGASIKSLN